VNIIKYPYIRIAICVQSKPESLYTTASIMDAEHQTHATFMLDLIDCIPTTKVSVGALPIANRTYGGATAVRSVADGGGQDN
jgi:hypothetical protein